MSFILDALRKSELERQKNAPPGIANVPLTRRHSPRTVWVPIAVALLAANLLLLAWFSISPDETPPAVTTAALPSKTPEAATATPEPVRPLAQEARGASVSAPPPATTVTPKTGSPPSARTGNSTAASSGSSTDSAPQRVAKAQTSSRDDSSSGIVLPTLEELTVAGSLSLPPLHLDIHVYSNQRAERFVFVNMRKYREGDNLKEGPTVDSISEDGVVLIHQGRQFLLTRD